MTPIEDHVMRELPKTHLHFREVYPRVASAYERLGEATQEWGPLDKKSRELVKLGIAVGDRHEGAVHSHTRRALESGASPDEIRHVVLLSLTSIGFANMMAAMTWVEDVLRAAPGLEEEEESPSPPE
jgi:AhpD family alkylhydroperoxidase